MLKVEVEKRTRKLLAATKKLREMQGNIDEQRRRLQTICVDYPDHGACDIYSAAEYARESFCDDDEFTAHVDDVVKACEEGQCKQLDEAQFLSRNNYMRLVQRLPHSLVLFKAYDTKLDKKDRRTLQGFVEHIEADKGYVIVVGRASRDGSWRENVRLAIGRAESTRKFLVEDLGLDPTRAGYITYGDPKMYITDMDVERLTDKKLSVKQANRSALVFAYPCWN